MIIMKYRIEKDALGELKMPSEVYYGIHTLRGKENFQITKRGICRQLIKSITIVKKAAAKANLEAGMLDEKVAEAIMLACDEILNGRLHGQFVTDLIQGGAGESINMNANEVIANRANEMLGGDKGTYEFVDPIKHVNYGQATNDVIPTAGKLAVIKQLKKLVVELKKLENSFKLKSKEFGETRVGKDFNAMASLIAKDVKRIENSISDLSVINLGVNALAKNTPGSEKYFKKIILYINKYSGEDLSHDKNLVASTRSLDSFLWTSSCLKALAVGLSKAANDIYLLSSPEHKQITIPQVQEDASNNSFHPVIIEMVNQVAFYVMGLDVTVTKSVEAGQLSNNVFLPIILTSLFESITILRRAARTFRELVIEGTKLNK